MTKTACDGMAGIKRVVKQRSNLTVVPNCYDLLFNDLYPVRPVRRLILSQVIGSEQECKLNCHQLLPIGDRFTVVPA